MCKKCSQSKSVHEHENVNSVPKTTNVKICEHCGEQFDSQKSITKHLKEVHEEKQDLVSNSENFIKTKNVVHETPKNPNKEKLLANEALKNVGSKDGKVTCPNCNKEFNLMIKLKHHYIKMHIKYEKAKPQTKTIILIQSGQIVNEIEWKKCELCDKEFTDKQSLTEHILEKHENIDNKIRDSTSKEPPALQKFKIASISEPIKSRNHKIIGKNVKCGFCDKNFADNKLLWKHKKTNHTCFKCRKYFKDVNKHIKINQACEKEHNKQKLRNEYFQLRNYHIKSEDFFKNKKRKKRRNDF